MSEDISKKINQLTSMLGQEKLPDNVKNLLTSLSNAKTANALDDIKENDESYQTLKRVKNIMERLDASNKDERVILLNAVKPFLNSSRQKKLSSCIKILQMVSLSSLLDENQLLN